MPTLVNNLRAIRGPVTAVPMVGASGVVVEPDTVNNQVVVRADETVLWETTNAAGDTAPITLSESLFNFERIRIVARTEGNSNVGAPNMWEWYTKDLSVGSYINLSNVIVNNVNSLSTTGVYIRNSVEQITANNVISHGKSFSWVLNQTGSPTWQSTDTWGAARYFRIIGINRIAG